VLLSVLSELLLLCSSVEVEVLVLGRVGGGLLCRRALMVARRLLRLDLGLGLKMRELELGLDLLRGGSVRRGLLLMLPMVETLSRLLFHWKLLLLL
jgi:hypothetical protein